MCENVYDMIIVGSGPAGLTAGIYGKRAGLKVVILESGFIQGGQIVNTYEVDNYPGMPGISGLELAEKLNRTGAQLQAKNEMLSRRDNARTQWIAGVSHDVRTPLALILGWAEQLEQDALLPGSSRQKAAGIRTQCEKLRTLIDDLNLTSKLEYGAQPLRRKDLRAGPLFRQLVAQFCESPLAERCEITLEQEEPAEQTVLSVDEALLARLLENLMNTASGITRSR